jgi:hypothetical protein
VGKVLLAHAPAEVRQEVLAVPLRRFTPYTVTQPGRLEGQLQQIILEGYATTAEEMTLGACSIAVPVNAAGGTVASLGVVVSDFGNGQLLIPAMQVAARGIARSLPLASLHLTRNAYAPFRGELKGDVDDHVFLPARVARLADPLEDLVRGHAAPGRGTFGVQQEAGVDPGISPGDGTPVGERQPGQKRLHHVLGCGERALDYGTRLLLGEPVGHGVAAVAKRGVGDEDLRGCGPGRRRPVDANHGVDVDDVAAQQLDQQVSADVARADDRGP